MQIKRLIHTIDTHTGGESTRVVVHGYPDMPRQHPRAIRALFASQYDHLRRLLIWEPRGHQHMFGAVLLPTSQPDTDFGVVFMDTGGYLPMCIHGMIGVVVAAVESGQLSLDTSSKPLRIETPAGIVSVRFRSHDHSGLEVTVRNVPSFVAESDLEVNIGGRKVCVDVVYSGNFCALVEADQVGLSIHPRHLSDFIETGTAIRNAVDQRKKFVHPELEDDGHFGVDLVEFTESPLNSRAHSRTVVVFGAGQIDRSPCGTGTCAKMALLHSRGKLPLGQDFIQEGILGTTFTGRLVGEQKIDRYQGIIPEVTGTAFVTAIQQIVADARDPLSEGFLLGPESDLVPKVKSWI
jgi:proline racemase